MREDKIEITNRQLTIDKVFNSETTKRIVYRHNPTMIQNRRQRTWACSHTLPLLSSPWQQAGYIQTDEELLFVVPWGEDGKVWGQRPHVLYTCNERNESTANGNDNSMCLSPLSETVLWSRGGAFCDAIFYSKLHFLFSHCWHLYEMLVYDECRGREMKTAQPALFGLCVCAHACLLDHVYLCASKTKSWKMKISQKLTNSFFR